MRARELLSIIKSCNNRMNEANRQGSGMEQEMNSSIWWDAYNQKKAALNAFRELSGMHWTTSGDFSHLQSTPGVHF